MSYNFKFGEYWITELGAVSTETPNVEIAQRDGTLIKIPGKDGDDYIDNGRYNNVDISRSISVLNKKGVSVKDKAANLIDEYAYLQGYQDFEDTDHPGMVGQAVLQNFGEFNRKFRSMHSAQLKFSRKPFWMLKTGLQYVDMDLTAETPSITFNNPYKSLSLPIFNFGILVTGAVGTVAFSVTITTNGVSTVYNYTATRMAGGTSTTIIDCEKRASKQIINGTVFNTSSTIPDGFYAGVTTVEITSGKSNLLSASIAPRWRCL